MRTVGVTSLNHSQCQEKADDLKRTRLLTVTIIISAHQEKDCVQADHKTVHCGAIKSIAVFNKDYYNAYVKSQPSCQCYLNTAILLNGYVYTGKRSGFSTNQIAVLPG